MALFAILSGCSLFFGDDAVFFGGDDSPAQASACQKDPGSCLYNGRYEPDERDYAEQQARRLNQAEIQRLRRLSL